MGAIPLRQDIIYPESDGQPLGETDVHISEVLDLLETLRDWYRDQSDVYVAGNLFLYYVEGNPRAVVCPDLFVAKGVPKYFRRTYKLWEEGKAPCMVIEVTSRDTHREDTVGKRACYEELGIEEYFLHDPLGDYLDPPLRGFRLTHGRYAPMEPDRDGSLSSLTTGLRLRLDDASLRLVDAATGEPLLRGQEARDQARRERAAREAVEAELVRLRRELKRRDG